MKLSLLLTLYMFVFVSLLIGFEPHFVSDPTISPDGLKVCFVYQGDLWLIPFDGGTAQRLTSTDAPEFGPCWSPDGRSIAFTSNREGQSWAYIIPSTGGYAKPVFKETMTVCDWFSDSNYLLCSKSNLSWGSSLYKLPLDGTNPVLISEFGDYFSHLSPDNNQIIFNRYGEAYRAAYHGSKNGDLWTYNISRNYYQKLTDTNYTERYPQYSHVSNSVFFCASDSLRYQLYRVFNGDFDNKIQLTNFDTWSVRDISIDRTSDKIVFELFDSIWCYDPTRVLDKQIFKLPINISEDNWQDVIQEDKTKNSFNEFAVSEDDLLIAFSYKYDLFVMPRKGGEVRQITTEQSGINQIAFLSDNRTLVFSQYSDGIINLYKSKVDSIIVIEPIRWYGKGKFNVDRFYKSSDKWIIEYTDTSGGGRIAMADSSLTVIKPVITDEIISTDFVCSPDGTMAIYATLKDDIYIRELYIYDFLTETKKKILTDDAWLHNLIWSPNQKSVLLGRSLNNNRTISRLDLVPRDNFELDIDNWKEILSPIRNKVTGDSLPQKHIGSSQKYRSDPESTLKFAQIDWFQIDKRLNPIITDSDFIYPVKAIDDTTFYYAKSYQNKDKKTLLYKTNIFGKNSIEAANFPQDFDYQFIGSKLVYYKDGDALKSYNLFYKSKTDIDNSLTYTYDKHLLNEKVFEQVWGLFGRNFYDPDMHNKDWSALYYRFKPYLKYADNTQVLEIIIEEMIGEINASHTGYYPRTDTRRAGRPVAYLGLAFNRRLNINKGLEISRIYQGTPLYYYYGIRDRDILYSINGTEITPYTSIDSLLTGKIDEKLELVFKSPGKEKKAIVKGLNWSTNQQFWFQDLIERRRSKTDELSGNRIGYVLIPQMNGSEYNNFISNVFTKNADKEALIIDIRGNVGGRIHNDLINFLSKKPNAYSTSRRSGAVKKESPNRTWTNPIVLLIDENSFSDAEVFPQLFKEAQLGTIIGVPTSGSVIGTWEVKLLDGSSMRMPGSGWYRLDGTNMEGNGAQPDIRIDMSLNDLVLENDLQLQKAVEVLLQKLK